MGALARVRGRILAPSCRRCKRTCSPTSSSWSPPHARANVPRAHAHARVRAERSARIASPAAVEASFVDSGPVTIPAADPAGPLASTSPPTAEGGWGGEKAEEKGAAARPRARIPSRERAGSASLSRHTACRRRPRRHCPEQHASRGSWRESARPAPCAPPSRGSLRGPRPWHRRPRRGAASAHARALARLSFFGPFCRAHHPESGRPAQLEVCLRFFIGMEIQGKYVDRPRVPPRARAPAPRCTSASLNGAQSLSPSLRHGLPFRTLLGMFHPPPHSRSLPPCLPSPLALLPDQGRAAKSRAARPPRQVVAREYARAPDGLLFDAATSVPFAWIEWSFSEVWRPYAPMAPFGPECRSTTIFPPPTDFRSMDGVAIPRRSARCLRLHACVRA